MAGQEKHIIQTFVEYEEVVRMKQEFEKNGIIENHQAVGVLCHRGFDGKGGK